MLTGREVSYQSPDVRSILYVLILSTAATAAASPVLNTSTITTLSPLSIYPPVNYTVPTHKCAKPRFFRSDHRPTWPECYRAIRTLPTSYDVGTFHNAGSNNGYRLPVTEKFGRCRAQVELAGREDAVSSWVAVTSSLDQLSALCRRTSSQEDRTGGWLLMGPEERIKVSLLGPDDSGFDFEGTGDVLKLNGTDFE